MSIATRQAEIVWDGPLASGTGTLSSGSGALSQLPVTWASRTERPDGKTSPEELIAAAHASCFAMALALVLGENHTPPERLVVSGACMLDEIAGAPQITTVELTDTRTSARTRASRLRTLHGQSGRPLPRVKRGSRKCRDQRAKRARTATGIGMRTRQAQDARCSLSPHSVGRCAGRRLRAHRRGLAAVGGEGLERGRPSRLDSWQRALGVHDDVQRLGSPSSWVHSVCDCRRSLPAASAPGVEVMRAMTELRRWSMGAARGLALAATRGSSERATGGCPS